MKRFLTNLTSGAAVLLLAHCTPSTPQTRIARNYSLYESLPAKHQELVSRGRIDKGMSKDAVYLAFGPPTRQAEGFRDNARFERWDYTRLRPYYHHNFYTYYGSGWGYGPYGRYYHGYGFGPTVEFIPYRAASVFFRRGVVDSWERLTPPGY